MDKIVTIKVEESTYNFFKDIADIVDRPIEEILSDALFKCVDIIIRRAVEEWRACVLSASTWRAVFLLLFVFFTCVMYNMGKTLVEVSLCL